MLKYNKNEIKKYNNNNYEKYKKLFYLISMSSRHHHR